MELFSSDGSPATLFKPGDQVKIRFFIKSNVDIENLVMSLFIKRNDGMVVFDATSDILGGKYFSFSEGERKTVDLSFTVNLPLGIYYVGMNFYNPLKGFYLYKDETIEFFVDAPKTVGYAFLDLKW
mgnify:FL=1